MIDLNEVAMFVQVIRAGSFIEAARRLGIPANTLSRRVRQLETRLETRLMQRSTRKLTLTTAGHAFFEQCAPAVEKVLDTGQRLVDGSQTPGGSFRVAAPAGFFDLFRIEWVAEFLASHPRVRIDFVLDDAAADLIGEGIDMAFRAGVTTAGGFTVQRIIPHYLVLLASPGYLEQRGAPAELQALAQHDCLTASSRQGRTVWRLQGPHGAEEVQVSGRLAANDARVLLKACVEGLGIALMPSTLCAREVAAGRLARVLPQYRRGGADFSVLFPSREQIPLAVSAFADFAQAKFRAIAIEGAFDLPGMEGETGVAVLTGDSGPKRQRKPGRLPRNTAAAR